MIRLFDIIFATAGLLVLSPVMVVLFSIGLLDTGSPIFRQQILMLNQLQYLFYPLFLQNLKFLI